MKTAGNKLTDRAHSKSWMQWGRGLATGAILALGLVGAAQAAPANGSNVAQGVTQSAPASTAPAASPTDAAPATVMPNRLPDDTDGGNKMAMDLSVWGMFQHADIVVKAVMIGLVLASIVTWTILFAKGSELSKAKRRLRREQLALAESRTLDQATELAQGFGKNSVSASLLYEAQNELQLSSASDDNNGIKERSGFRLERRVAGYTRDMGRGTGFLATIGAISPFVGLFGTVWGIMNSFIGIAHSQTTNLAVVAPGIAEALLATAMGLVAAIPAVVIYNIFSRLIAAHRAQVGDVAAQVLLLLGRDLDVEATSAAARAQHAQKLRVG